MDRTAHRSGRRNLLLFLLVFPTVVFAQSTPCSQYSSLQACHDALPPEGGEMSIASGTYKLQSRLVISKPNVTLRGSGVGATILQAADNARLGAVVSLQADHANVYNLTVDGNGGNNGSSAGIETMGSHVTIDHVEMRNAGGGSGQASGLNINGWSGQTDFLVTNSRFVQNGGTCSGCSGTGVWAGNAPGPNHLRFIGNWFEENYNHSPFYGPGYSVGFGVDAFDVVLVGNTFVNNLNHGGGQIGNLGSAGVTRNWIIADNKVILNRTLNGDDTSGIEIAFLGATITGNSIDGGRESCIVLEGAGAAPGAGNATISGNTCRNAAYGISLIDATSGVPAVTGVVLEGNAIAANTAPMRIEANVRNVTMGYNAGAIPLLYAQLPSGGATSPMWISDASTNAWGSAVSGGGGYSALVAWNGYAYTVVGR